MFLVYVPGVRSWCTFLVYVPGVRSWCTFLVYVPGVRSWCTLLVYVPGVRSWCTFLVYVPGVRSWCTFLVYVPGVRSWCTFLVIILLDSYLILQRSLRTIGTLECGPLILNPFVKRLGKGFSIVKSVGQNGSKAILDSMALTQEEQRDIQNATIGQRVNPQWHLFRRGRVTASNFGDVLMSNGATDNLLDRVLGNHPSLEGIPAICWGIENEHQAVQKFIDETQKEVQESGLWLSPSGVLGASPDGLVGSSEILEVKCPYNAREMTIDDAVKQKKISYISKEGDTYSLHRDHKYWHQVQGQLHLTGRQTCYFVVWTKKDHVIIPISKDDTWKPNLQVLEDFFKTHVLPRLPEM
ncbi:hypothetical protein E1301_Tti012156 [Triplophysa tibetana]|uniref:YqaJ viral recombinase domain-containing protein n=1 Tax=Triplophysa tibetana TaxID=1572043 RepID=A0A5A9P623_9TELE|nr:hypothetical protein E1301_Tti012156 [Triplophysa tibetana]